MTTKVLFGGDVCASLGLRTLKKLLPQIIEREKINFTIINGENVIEGSGVDEDTGEIFFEYGTDVITGGNHTLEKFDMRTRFGKNPYILRPHNLPFARGSGIAKLEKDGVKYAVINLMGRENMRTIDCPFQTADQAITEIKNDPEYKDAIILVDFHAESTTEKESLGFYLDGRVALVTGSHTHTQTSDEKILPQGTAYITDAGLIGGRDTVIGGIPKHAIMRALTLVPGQREWPEIGTALFCGIIVEINTETKKANSIKRVRLEQTF